MRTVFFPVIFVFALSLSALASSHNFEIRVVDPNSVAVSGAQVTIYPVDSNTALALRTTSGEGVVTLVSFGSGDYRVEVLAPGFAPQTLSAKLPDEARMDVRLKLAPRQETVVVTASDSPLPIEDSGASASVFDRSTLELMQPVSVNEALRFLPGAIINGVGRRGSLSSLFVRGGDSRYNKVIVDGVSVNDPGGTFDFSVVPLTEVDRLEFVRGADSTLYGSDAMTSVVQLFTSTGHTRSPQFDFGADGGTFSTAHGYASAAGAVNRFDYNLFGDQFNTQGQGVNDDYSNSSQGANLGALVIRGPPDPRRGAVQCG